MADPLILVRGVHFAATLLACGTAAFTVLVAEPAATKIQADPLRTRVHNLERFVTVKGGAYFFLPSVRALRYLASL